MRLRAAVPASSRPASSVSRAHDRSSGLHVGLKASVGAYLPPASPNSLGAADGVAALSPLRPLPTGYAHSRRGVATASYGGLVPLGKDLLTFLGSTVVIIPVFRRFNISPVLGFLAAGVLLEQFGMTHDKEDLSKLSQLGVLFLLFEMGLELSLDRLKVLAKYAFGIGSLQMLICIGIFTAFALPAGMSMGMGIHSGVGTELLHELAHAPTDLVRIRTIDEAVVIGAALSLSSSAFVLQLLGERGELTSRFGSATLGVLLFQDIAVVPFLVLLPLLESGMITPGETPMSLIKELAPTALLTVGGLGAALLGGRVVLRRIFEVVADSRNPEAFVAMCLLTVAGAAMLTEELGFSDTLGAFIAGILLAETNFKTQVEADIKPFRGLLLGLFFVTTGSSISLTVLAHNWQLVAWILCGLLTVKTAVIATLGRLFGLSGNEAVRLGFTLSQGGEFAFVLLSLAMSLKVLDEDLNQILIIVVVMSMAMTPALAEGGKLIADKLDEMDIAFGFLETSSDDEGASAATSSSGIHEPMSQGHGFTGDPIVICGFGLQAQMLANMLESPQAGGQSYIAFDLDPKRVQVARAAGFAVIYGDGSRQAVLEAAGVETPKAIVVCMGDRTLAVHTVHSLRNSYKGVHIYACGKDLKHAAQLEEAGADSVVLGPTMAGMALGAAVLEEAGISNDDISFLRNGITEALVAQTQLLAAELSSDGSTVASVELLVLDRDRHIKVMTSIRRQKRAKDRKDRGLPPSSLSSAGSIDEGDLSSGSTLPLAAGPNGSATVSVPTMADAELLTCDDETSTCEVEAYVSTMTVAEVKVGSASSSTRSSVPGSSEGDGSPPVAVRLQDRATRGTRDKS